MIYLFNAVDNISDLWLNRALAVLPSKKQDEILRYRRPDDQKRGLLSYLLLLYGLRCEYQIKDIPELSRAYNGKPFLPGKGLPHFNMSHSGNMVGCALSPDPVGLDIQQTIAVSPEVIRMVCTPEEISAVQTPEAFCALWTRKESVAKLTGQGLTDDFKNVLVRYPDAKTQTQTLENGAYFLSLSTWTVL